MDSQLIAIVWHKEPTWNIPNGNDPLSSKCLQDLDCVLLTKNWITVDCEEIIFLFQNNSCTNFERKYFYLTAKKFFSSWNSIFIFPLSLIWWQSFFYKYLRFEDWFSCFSFSCSIADLESCSVFWSLRHTLLLCVAGVSCNQ